MLIIVPCQRVLLSVDSSADASLPMLLHTMSISSIYVIQTQESIFTVVAGVLHVGQIDFKGLPDGESCAVQDAAVVATAAHVLGLDAEALTEALITRVRVIPPHHEVSRIPTL
jgi:myosin heavy subunit